MKLDKSCLFAILLSLFVLNLSVLPAMGAKYSKREDARKGEHEELLLFFEKEALVSVANLHPQKPRKAPSIVSVITAEQIKNMGARNLAEVLITVPGLGLQTSQGWGRTEFEVRGVGGMRNSEKVLVLLDGHRLNDPLFGGATTVTDDLPMENIEQIEIIRGPGSALYGANAFMAVINIISKKAEDIDGVQVNIGYGDFQTSRYNILFGKKMENDLKLSVNLDYFETESEKRVIPEDEMTIDPTKASEAPGFSNNYRKRCDTQINLDYENLGMMARFIHKKHGLLVGARDHLGDDSLAKFNALYSEIHYEHDFSPELKLYNKIYYDLFTVDFLFEVFPEGTNGFAGTGTFDEGALYQGKAKEETVGDELRLDYELFEDNMLTMGFVWEYIAQSDVRTRSNYNPMTPAPHTPLSDGFSDVSDEFNFNKNEDRTVLAFYAQDSWQVIDELALTLGVRHDYYDDVGGNTNPRMGLVYSPLAGLDLKALYGEAFRAPNFEELYNRNNGGVLGDDNLDPEKLRTAEFGLEYGFLEEKIRFGANYFYSEIEDLIVLDSDPTGEALRRFQNQKGARVRGVETELKANFMTNDYGYSSYFYVNYTYQHAINVETHVRLPHAPMHRGNAGLNLAVGKYVNVQPHMFVSGERTRDEKDSRDPLGGYTLVDLAANVRNFYETLEIRASVHNLFDRKYVHPSPFTYIPASFPRPVIATALPDDYPQQGRDFFVELAYKF